MGCGTIEEISRIACLCYSIWNDWNKLFFEDKPFLSRNIVHKASFLSSSFLQVHDPHVCSYPRLSAVTPIMWQASLSGHVKMNCDACIAHSDFGGLRCDFSGIFEVKCWLQLPVVFEVTGRQRNVKQRH